jgi:hypothetical protein
MEELLTTDQRVVGSNPIGVSKIGGLAHLARATALHVVGDRFESDILHIERVINITAVI